jgi:16S rRNA (guanine1207-N2)-methyltransferase
VVLLRCRAPRRAADIGGPHRTHADPEVVVFAGGRIKHMSVAMNDVLGAFFAAST